MTEDSSSRQREADKLLISAHRLRWFTLSVMVGILAIGVVVLGVIAYQEHQQIAKQEKQLEASCSFYEDLGSAPLPVTEPKDTPKPNVLGVRIIVHSRVAFTGQDCSGELRPPGPGLMKWAQFYSIRLPH
jgi:hypothetical protein